MENKLTIFVSHHPGDLLLYKNLIAIEKALDKNAHILLIKVLQSYYESFDFTPYKDTFDEVIELPFITYRKNIVKGIAEIFSFLAIYKKVQKRMEGGKVNIFMGQSAWLPINTLLYRFAKEKTIANIYRWDIDMRQARAHQMKTDALRTFYCAIYRLFLASYRVRAIATQKGKFSNFLYADTAVLPGKLLYIVNPTQKRYNQSSGDGKTVFLPYPLLAQEKDIKDVKKDMIIIFGDAGILDSFGEYVDDYAQAQKNVERFFKTVRELYGNCSFYYKPHPADGKKLMPGINDKDYTILSNKTNAQGILDAYHSRIKAVYTFSSTSILWSSFFGIPSYLFYRLIYNKTGINLYDEFFANQVKDNEYVCNMSDIKEIGKIDGIKQSAHYIDLGNINEIYKEIFVRQ